MIPSRPRAARLLILGLLCLLAGPSCAYYNTFYLAKRYYREAKKEHEKSLSDVPSPAAQARYDLVIRQCRKVIDEYPTSKYVDDAQYLMGAALYGKGDYPSATRQLTAFVEKFSGSPFVPDARFTLGLAHLKRKDYDVADSVLRAHLASYPKFERRVERFHAMGETQMGLRRYPEAVHCFRQAQEIAGKRQTRSDALHRLGDALTQEGRHDSAEVVFANCLRVEDRGPVRMEVALKRAESLREIKRYDEALQFLEQWKPIALVEKREGDLYLRIYELDARLGHTEEALAGYRDLIERFPRTNVSSEAQFRIGYLYETMLEDYDRAAVEYNKLGAEQVSEFQRQALRRIQGLETMKRYRETLANDTTLARARAAFQMAELYYFQLEKVDSALIEYERIERDYPRSIYAPKSGYARLWITMNEHADTSRAMALTDTMARRYRGTRFAESALYLWKKWSGRDDERVALLDSLLANPDTSRAGEFERGPELPPVTPAAFAGPSLPTMPAGLTEAEQARLDSLRRALIEGTPEAHKAVHRPQGRGTGRKAQPNLPPGITAAPDSAAAPDSVAALGRLAVPDSSAVPDSLAAPDDAAEREPETIHPEPAPADTAGLPLFTPSR